MVWHIASLLSLFSHWCNGDNRTYFAFLSGDTLWYEVLLLFFMTSESNTDLTHYSSGLLEKGPGVKRLSLLDDKIPPKSPRPRRTIWLSRSQSDIFSSKPPRTVNVLDRSLIQYLNKKRRGDTDIQGECHVSMEAKI